MRNEPTIINSNTREETAPGVAAAFPYRAVLYELNESPERLCPWHWHNEVELFYMVSGALTYSLPGRTCVFSEGDVGFINADVLHMTSAISEPNCIQHIHIFQPRLIGGFPGDSIQTKYVEPLLRNPAVEMVRIPADDPAAAGLREWMDRALAVSEERGYGYEMRIRSYLSETWLEIARRAALHEPACASADTMRIKAMLQYISEHYPEPITLDEIAAAAHISAREGSRCFRRQLNTTAFDYILDLRIDRACELLRSSRMTVTEIAAHCGFSSASYFGKVFRERMGATPRDYRNGREENASDFAD